MEHDTNKTKKGCHGSPSAAGGSRYMQLSNAQEDARMAEEFGEPLSSPSKAQVTREDPHLQVTS
ncbi:unnamed protein product [Penicillium camemberti]|uniref:Str. FM013 n=1 Tax=Penicillium camemberti (strain FM 013) TaxID=1429867 RepID=A0A0G4PE27_PENC3|nr:unnamed protein product [Penicillium camemberti]